MRCPEHGRALRLGGRHGDQRAQRAFLAHRKAKAQGLVVAGPVAPADAANQNRTNEFCTIELPVATSPGQVVEPAPSRPAAAKPSRSKKAAEPDEPEAELDDEAWLASLPVVEDDPEREAERRRALMKVEPREVRRTIGHAPLDGIEHYLVAGDPVAYEAWFARQPKPPRVEMAFMTEEDVAAVNWVTRHNPPWARGKYLGYYRPPVPAHLFEPGAVGEDDHRSGRISCPLPPRRNRRPGLPRPWPTCAPASPGCSTAGQPRRPEELDLAEAICAVKWPNWPEYKGALDPFLLRRALVGAIIDTRTLQWLGSQELAQACREGQA